MTAVRQPRRLTRLLRPLLMHAAIACLMVVAGVYAAMLVQQLAAELYRDSGIASYSPHEATLVYDDEGEIIARLYLENRELLRLTDVPPRVINTFLATEDHTFYEHHGFSPRGLARATLRNLRAGRTVEGASTITEQLAKNMIGTMEQTFKRKFRTILLALELERRLTKDEILEKYFNQIYFGDGVYGLKAAARFYFSKEVKDLTLLEAAALAGVPKNPSRYSPYSNRDECLGRARDILARMRQLNLVTDAEQAAALNEALALGSREILRYETQAPYFVEYLRRDLVEQLGKNLLYSGGLRIHTTVNLKMQHAAEEALLTTTDRQGAVLILDPRSGQIKAMVGGRGTPGDQYNRAVQAQRQPGSAFKPFVYLTALMKGYTAATILKDEPTTFPDFGNWKPQNYSRTYVGPIALQRALERSLNIPTAVLADHVGISTVIETAQKLGITSELQPALSLALGAGEVNLMEMTAAYAVFANGGVRCAPAAIRHITDGEGRMLDQVTADDGHVITLDFDRPRHAVLSANHAYLITHILQGVMTRGTGAGSNLARPCAGKTGTTDSEKSVWFIGYTPDLVCGVYIGNDDNTPLRRRGGAPVTGGSIPAPIWKKTMTAALAGRPALQFQVPSTQIVFREVCATSGMLAVQGCPGERMAFMAGTEPVQSCVTCQGSDGLLPLNAEEIFYDEIGW